MGEHERCGPRSTPGGRGGRARGAHRWRSGSASSGPQRRRWRANARCQSLTTGPFDLDHELAPRSARGRRVEVVGESGAAHDATLPSVSKQLAMVAQQVESGLQAQRLKKRSSTPHPAAAGDRAA